MSAWMCSATHIAAIVGTVAAFDPLWREDLGKVAAVLAAENGRSVGHRYRGRMPCDPVEVSQSEIDTFRARPLSPVQFLKAVACLEYQSCECDDYQTTEAFRLVQRLRAVGIAALPGYSAAPWGLDDGWRP
jgi:hypothetical protein